MREKKKSFFRHACRKLYDRLLDPGLAIERQAYKIAGARRVRACMLSRRLSRRYAVWIAPGVIIGEGLKLPHYMGVVIGEGVVIGKNCTIYQQVTLGQRNGEYPVLGDNVVVYAGAKILGGISVGSNTVVGANAVVVKDIPPGSVVAGVPARVVRELSATE